MKRDDSEHSSHHESPLDTARDAGKSFPQSEVLDIVDGIKPSSSKSRTLELLPAIEESAYEDKLAQELECTESLTSSSSASSPNLLVRHTALPRVSSKPTLMSISEELIMRSCEHGRAERLEDDSLSVSESSAGSRKPGSTKPRVHDSAENVVLAYGNETDSEVSLAYPYMHDAETSLDEAVPQPDGSSEIPRLFHRAGGEGVVPSLGDMAKVDDVSGAPQFLHSAGDEGRVMSSDKSYETHGNISYTGDTLHQGTLGTTSPKSAEVQSGVLKESCDNTLSTTGDLQLPVLTTNGRSSPVALTEDHVAKNPVENLTFTVHEQIEARVPSSEDKATIAVDHPTPDSIHSPPGDYKTLTQGTVGDSHEVAQVDSRLEEDDSEVCKDDELFSCAGKDQVFYYKKKKKDLLPSL